jgi:hypothetical protein
MEAIAFPAAEGLFISWAAGQYPGLPVSNRVSGQPKFVRIQRTGGVSPDPFHDEPQLTFEFYAADTEQAEDFATDGRRRLWAMKGRRIVEGVVLKNINELSFYEDPDPDSSSARWTFTFTARLRITG